MKKHFLILSVWALCTIVPLAESGCTDKDPQIEYALQLAKGNRPELEKVLNHYRNDSLKLEAAKFLIRNMPGHYSFADSSVYRYYNALDSALNTMKGRSPWEVKDSLEVVTDHLPFSLNTATVPDVEIITADYLIQNIDTAFTHWHEGTWATHLTFEQFCEYLLPYKIDDLYALDNWREYMKSTFGREIEVLQYCDSYKNSAIQAATHVNKNLRNDLHPVFSTSRVFPIYRLSTKVKQLFGLCDDYTAIATAALRSCGIPVAYDFTPQWPFRSMGHTWNIVLANSGQHIPFGGADTDPGQPHKLDEKMAKVFRKTYVANPDLQRLNETEKYIPSTFRTVFIKDVTPEYMDCADIEIAIDGEDNRYAYLAVFDNHAWVPVDFARIDNGKACFRNVGKNIAYLPVRYEKDDTQIPAGDPFILTYSGKTEYIKADTLQKQTLILNRKYPVYPHAYTWAWRTVNGVFQAADNPDFHNAITVHTIKEWGVTGTEVQVPDSCGAHRYWRYWQPHEFNNMAEIYFVEKNTHKFIEGKIIGTDGAWGGNENLDKTKAFDRDLLTYFDAPDHGAWVGMDFGSPVSLETILYVGRGDGNTIEIGDSYELFYWDKKTWKSLGKQTAEWITLTYSNAPTGSLFWLKDLTKGKEERIFTYEKGKQVWW